MAIFMGTVKKKGFYSLNIMLFIKINQLEQIPIYLQKHRHD